MSTIGLYTSATGMKAQNLMIDTISHDLANLNTTAFKRHKAEFKDLLYLNKARNAQNSEEENVFPLGLQVGLGVKPAAVTRVHSQGNFEETGKNLDVAIRGKGYFIIELPNGEIRYTRDGTFTRNADGEIVTSEGYIVSPNIVIPDDAVSISINPQGEVRVSIADEPETTLLGQFELAKFINENGLEAVGSNLFKETEASGAPIEELPDTEDMGSLLQYYIETSNVDSIISITELIRAHRAYDLNLRCMNSINEMLRALTTQNL